MARKRFGVIALIDTRTGREVGKKQRRHCSRRSDLARRVRADRVADCIKRVDGLEGELVVCRGLSGGQRNAAQIEEALSRFIVRAEAIERIALSIAGSGDDIAHVPLERSATGSGHGIADIRQVGSRDHGAQNSVDPLHALAAPELDRPLDGDGVGRGELFSREGGDIGGCDWIDPVERGDIVQTERRRVRHADLAGLVA